MSEAATGFDVSLLMSHIEEVVVNPALRVFGSSGIMFVIVGLLYLWEVSVEWARVIVGPSLRPVVESILAEIGGLGFIGLILQSFAPPNRELLEKISVTLFGEGEILIETFEFLHNSFFQVGVAFFVAAGAMVYVGIQKLAEIESVEGFELDDQKLCSVSPRDLTKYLDPCDANQLPPDTVWDEVRMPKQKRAGLTLLLRSRLVEKHCLPATFRVEKYIKGAFASNLQEIVELSPLTWIYIIPALALANSIDLSHDVINANSPNAFESSGFFLKDAIAIVPSTITVLLSLVWGYFNAWKFTMIKKMIIPRLAEDSVSGEPIILPPAVDVDHLREKFCSSPNWVRPVEQIWAEPANTNYEQLFGIAGGAGLELYLNSIKLHSWLCITNVVFFGTQIVPRDVNAVLTGAEVGAPEFLKPELLIYASFVFVSLLQLIFISPRAFWSYCLVACSEDGVSEELLESSVVDIGIE